jgi:hypothetical protein
MVPQEIKFLFLNCAGHKSDDKAKRFRCTEKRANTKKCGVLTGTPAWPPCPRSARERSQAMIYPVKYRYVTFQLFS